MQASFSQIAESGAVRVTLTLPPEGCCFCGKMDHAWTCTKCKQVTCAECWTNCFFHHKTCSKCGADVCRSCSKRDFWTDDWHRKGCENIKRTSGTCGPGCGAKGDKEILWCCTHCLRQVCYACEDDFDDHGHECQVCGAESCHQCSKTDDWHRPDCDRAYEPPQKKRFVEIASGAVNST